MKKIILLLLCCGLIVSMVGCGSNTAPPPSETATTVAETVITDTHTETTPPKTAVEPTEKEKEPTPTESTAPATEPTTTAPATTAEPTDETKPTETATPVVATTKEETITSQITETVSNTTPQIPESEPIVTEPPKEDPKPEPIQETAPETETAQPEFDIQYWITFAKEYAVSIGLKLDSEAVNCWDNPIGANSRCIYLERDIKSRLNRYAKDEEITDVWIWAESVGDSQYEMYIGYA